jgi:hypothetical protein
MHYDPDHGFRPQMYVGVTGSKRSIECEEQLLDPYVRRATCRLPVLDCLYNFDDFPSLLKS